MVKALAEYRPANAAMWRVSAFGSIRAASWPGTDGSGNQWRAWIAKVWAYPGVAEAITQASPILTEQVLAVLDGSTREDRRLPKIGHALARYVVRMRGRATPFGLFAGVAPLRFGLVTAADDDQERTQVRLRANGDWIAAVIAALEATPGLVRRLQVTANDLVVARGRRLHVQWQPHGGDPKLSRPLEVSLRYTGPVAFALALAEHPIAVADLTGKVQVQFPAADVPTVESLIEQLMATGALITQLRPPSTDTDPLGHVLRALDAIDLSAEPATSGMRSELQEIHTLISRDTASDGRSRARLAARMRAITSSPDRPLGIDVRAGGTPTVSRQIAAEAAKAVRTLLQLSWAPTGLPAWREYHDRFLERYGAGALVPVADLVDPAAGLGYPRHFAASPAPFAVPWSKRDERLARLAQQAALDGATEVHLGDVDVAALAGVDDDHHRGRRRSWPAHLDATIEVRAVSAAAVDRGDFTLTVNGLGRSIVALSGRFLDLMPGHQENLLATVPTIVDGATVAQLSFPPRRPAAETVTRVQQVLPTVISVCEHRPDAGNAIRLRDLAVTADLDRMYVVTLTGRQIIEPVVTSAAAPHTMPPVVRLLLEIHRAAGPALSLFDWGAAAHLPFLPRLRYGRTILSPACWHLCPDVLPGPDVPPGRWETALGRLRERLRLPGHFLVGDGDQQLRLSLDEPMDQALLRAHLNRATDPVMITEAAGPDEFGWCAGRAHEIVVPLLRTGPGAQPSIVRRLGHRPVVGREDGHLPGTGVLFGKLYGQPEAFSTIICEYLPQLVDHEDDAWRWWFVRHRDPYPHLRIRQTTDDFGRDAARLGRWAAQLRRLRLAGDLALDTYRPETSRYGTGPALQAAENLFVADSAAAAAQLAACRGPCDDADAITAISHLDLLTGLLGTRHAAIRWLLDRADLLPRSAAHSREARRRALTLARVDDPDPRDPYDLAGVVGGAQITAAWQHRRIAARDYALRLAADPAAPAADEVARSLLHLHHNRAAGIGPDNEARIYHLARAVALAAAARSGAATPGRS